MNLYNHCFDMNTSLEGCLQVDVYPQVLSWPCRQGSERLGAWYLMRLADVSFVYTSSPVTKGLEFEPRQVFNM